MKRWRVVDESDWLENISRKSDFKLYYARIYPPGEGFKYSDTNNYILNLKISPSEKNRIQHKNQAIDLFSQEVSEFLIDKLPSNDSPLDLVLVPIPPSKSPSDDNYDDRMLTVARKISQRVPQVRYADLLSTIQSKKSFSKSGNTRDTRQILDNLQVNEILLDSTLHQNSKCVLIDDVLTSGAHFVAAQEKLFQYSINVRAGIFWAKSQYPQF